mmetsp:Transcript_33164/g.98741  ORF Transcript_33164/g.98741 Transcript_33164/m.98741 type:complete len:254 (-) Transcript_33164:599-1360(-)
MWTWWSPRCATLPRRGTPRLAMSSVVPGCVPDGIFSSTGPSTVGTLTCVPRIASTYEISTSEWMVVPSRRSSGCVLTEMNTYRSPDSPPRRPELPSPRTRSRLPVSTPAGTLSWMRLLSRTRPSPPHFSQGVTICPVPSHRGHVDTCWNAPSGVRTACTYWPVPWHCGQVLAVVPLLAPEPSQVPHDASRSTSSSFAQPKTASRKSSCRSNLSSSPGTARVRVRPPKPPMPPPKPAEPPKNDSKRSKGLEKSP